MGKAHMTFTKSQAVELVIDRIGFTKNKSVDVIEQLLEIIKKSLVSGDDVMISNFGKFHVADKGKRKGRNPVTGESMILPARRVITFKASKNLRDKINGEK